MSDPNTTIRKPEYVRRRLREIGFWFVDIPRTSSTSLRRVFYRRHGKLFGKPSTSQGIGIGLVPPHLPARYVIDQIGSELWGGLYTFTIVRNPFERLLSLYQFLRANGKLTELAFPDYVRQLTDGKEFRYHGHSMSNLGYLTDNTGSLRVKEVFRFEDRENAVRVIAQRTGCPELIEQEKRVYETRRNHYSAYYNNESVKRVSELFRDDLEYFGYRFDRE